MASTTSYPAVTDALLARITAAPALAGVQILDGQPTRNITLDPDVIVVGFSTDRPAMEITQSRQNLSATRDREEYDLVCLVSSWRGDPGIKAVRDRCAEMVDAVNGVLIADRRLGGACLQAQMSVANFAPVQTDTGPSCTAEVLISITALTKR
jgi:hypothetical protein